ncbi:MAG: tRNA pseudouridine(55) synthase TruB, partial [Streptococcus mitis]|nr:tRNA pseudouridine(55) synthase TruB [Streptococcus mitis]
YLSPEQATEVRFGRFIELEQSDKELAAFEDDKLLAILEKRGNLYKPRKVFS